MTNSRRPGRPSRTARSTNEAAASLAAEPSAPFDDEGARSRQSEKPAAAQRRAEAKYELFLESLAGRKPTGELLSEAGFSSAELSRIRAAVRRGAMVELSRGRGRPRKDQRLRAASQELRKIQTELNEMALHVKLLQAKQACGLVGPIRAAGVSPAFRRILVDAVTEACDGGLPVAQACAIIELSRQRYYAWRSALGQGDTAD